ncbi:hypothetical protein OKC48_06760 [Methylorubrum extorquens]|uniref:hypothetical protein n=1 Tax=Methylorubrum extorquens TaxID=408 RepID=UPI002236F0E0|nr:hypothetical protein [Methylorubrum extorquens]UYW28215.1 hypothetical protein OKC48_06760 [Methylorubrum extorquens]
MDDRKRRFSFSDLDRQNGPPFDGGIWTYLEIAAAFLFMAVIVWQCWGLPRPIDWSANAVSQVAK